MRARQRFAEARAAELVSHHRFSRGVSLARRGGKARAVAHRLEKQQDDLRSGVIGEYIHQLSDSQVCFVPDRNELGKSQPSRGAAREHRSEHGAALRHHARGARRERIDLEHRVDRERNAARNVS